MIYTGSGLIGENTAAIEDRIRLYQHFAIVSTCPIKVNRLRFDRHDHGCFMFVTLTAEFLFEQAISAFPEGANVGN